MSNRYTRYAGIIEPHLLADAVVDIIGVGAIGRQVALHLATIGIGKVNLWDFDTIEPLNYGPQGFRPDQDGQLKVDATAEDMLRINPAMVVNTQPHRWFHRDKDPVSPAYFCCVDNMESRRMIFEKLLETGKYPFFCDTRMGAQNMKIISVTPATFVTYEYSLFDSSEAFGAPCTMRSTYYCASIAAGLAVVQLMNHLREFPVDTDVELSLPSMTMLVSDTVEDLTSAA
jgi:hypothetical protein